MADEIATTTGIARHGATRLPSVDVDSFNVELKDDEGFIGDRASKGAFRKILETLLLRKFVESSVAYGYCHAWLLLWRWPPVDP